MKIVSITLLRNEEDIVEAFVRYHAQFFDHMIVIDHESTDATLSILQELEEEGLPLTIKHEKRFGHIQSEVLTEEMRNTQADWIVPIDADEFLEAHGKNIREILSSLSCDCVQKVIPRIYVPLKKDDANEPNIFHRIRNHRTIESERSASVLIPGSIALQDGTTIAQGNHEVLRDGTELTSVVCDELSIAHFPYRSVMQTTKKIIAGWGRTVAGFGTETSQAFHWKENFEKMRAGKILEYADLEKLALEYPRIGREQEKQKIVDDPFVLPTEILKKITWQKSEDNILRETLSEFMHLAQAHYEIDQESREQARYIDELERRLDGILKSKTWRWTQGVRNVEARIRNK